MLSPARPSSVSASQMSKRSRPFLRWWSARILVAISSSGAKVFTSARPLNHSVSTSNGSRNGGSAGDVSWVLISTLILSETEGSVSLAVLSRTFGCSPMRVLATSSPMFAAISRTASNIGPIPSASRVHSRGPRCSGGAYP